MKKLPLAAFTGMLLLLAGCCHCHDREPFLEIDFENYSSKELSTAYILNSRYPDTCFTCVDTTTQSAYIMANAYTSYQVKSDSVPLHKTIQVKKIRSESSRYFLCDPCRTITGIDYELDGRHYTNKPILITK